MAYSTAGLLNFQTVLGNGQELVDALVQCTAGVVCGTLVTDKFVDLGSSVEEKPFYGFDIVPDYGWCVRL